MKTFSRLSLFTLVCFGLALIPFVSIADAQEPFLEVVGSEGFTPNATVGTELTVIFKAGNDGAGESGLPLRISATTSSIQITSPTPVPGTHNTGPGGVLTVKGRLIRANVNSSITAVWNVSPGRTLDAAAKIDVDDDPAPVVIIVNPPKNVKPDPMVRSVGSTFTQEITMKNKDTDPTLPLSAWQMDVGFNPLVLGVVKVTEGDFLKSGGKVTYYTEKISSGKISVSQSLPGHTDLTPLTPDGDEDVAKPTKVTGNVLQPGQEGTLLTIEFRVLAIAEAPLEIGNVRLQSSRDHDDADKILDRISYSILIEDVFVATHQSPEPVDVNQDLKVNILDLVMVASSIGVVPHNPRADVNGDGFVNVLDLITVYNSPDWGKSVKPKVVGEPNEPALTAAPSISHNPEPAMIQNWIDLAVIEDDGSTIFDLGIANLEALLTSRIPNKTRLLLNYPNPFNPETWIPYQLSEASDVTVTIHAMNGSLIRTLTLGHQAAGIYQSKNQAAYWDGRNELGEQVASGLYFYTLTAGNFSATGKMLVRK